MSQVFLSPCLAVAWGRVNIAAQEPVMHDCGLCTQDSGEYLAKLLVVGTGRWGAAGLVVVFLCTVVGSRSF